jgi:N-methylhydantoinase A
MLTTDLRRDYLRTQVFELSDAAAPRIAATYEAMIAEARSAFAADPVAGDLPLRFQRYADMRYAGQEHTVKIELPEGTFDAAALAATIARFHETHEREYTFRLGNPIELVNFHLVAWGAVPRHELEPLPATGRPLQAAITGRRRVDYDEHGVHEATIYDRGQLEPGAEFDGPCIVEEPAATLVVPPGYRVRVDAFGNLHVPICE